MDEPEPFGFSVRRALSAYPEMKPTDNWEVSFPNEQWSDTIHITGVFGSPHEAAVAEMERFVNEAQAALGALRERRETDG